MKKNSTRRALLTSVVALVICVTMLMGTTFAWFTDTATVAVNTIVSGKLDLELVDENGNALVNPLKFVSADKETTDILWEPGARYVTEGFKIKNAGNLAFKFKVVVTSLGTASAVEADEEVANLLEVITFDLVTKDAEGNYVTYDNGEVTVVAAEGGKVNDTVYYLRGVMDTEAGNKYMNMKVEGITITVYATQATVETDSFDNQYDANATYPVVNAADLKSALTNGGVINVVEDIAVADESAEAANVINGDATVNFGDSVITLDLPNATGATANWKGLDIKSGTVVLDGENGGVTTADNAELYAVVVGVKDGTYANVTIKGGTYIGGTTAVQVTNGTLTIEGGTFKVTKSGQYLLNCIDANYKNGTANIIVKGGTFYGFNPADNAAEGAGTNFVAEGYKSVEIETDVWTVIPE